MCCIGWDRTLDPELHDHYASMLLEPGWAGEINDAEAAYISRKLTDSPVLRRLWRVSEFTRRRKSITPAIAKGLARWWAEMPLEDTGVAFSNTVDSNARRSVRKNTSLRASKRVTKAEVKPAQLSFEELQPLIKESLLIKNK